MQVSISQPDRQNMKFHIAILNPAARSVTITIQRKDDLLFTETITNDRYENIYDLDQLEDGNYLITVRGGKEKFTRNISIHTETNVNRQAHLN